MKCSILLFIFFITGTVIYSQKISLVSDHISADFKFNKKADSIAAEITITTFSGDKICIPVFPGSSVIPRYE